MSRCLIIRPDDYIRHAVGDERSHSFQYEPQDLTALIKLAAEAGEPLVTHIVRIEVRDTDGDHLVHMHAGMTNVLITAGHGFFRDETGAYPVSAGDRIIVPPMTPHLSVAAKDTVMIEDGVYISIASDPQKIVHISE